MGNDANLQVGIDSTGAVTGARTVVRSIDDISASADRVDKQLQRMEAALGKMGSSSRSGLSQAKQAMDEMNSNTEKFSKLLDSIEQRFIRIGATAIAMWAVAKVFEAMIEPLRESVKYLALIETATLGIASSFLVVGNYVDITTNRTIKGQAALTLAQKDSKEVIDQLRIANMNTIATLDELITAYQTALPVAMARGFDKKQVLEFTTAMVQAAGAIGLPFNQMSEEIRSLLTEGAINPRNSRIATVMGLRNEDLAQYKNNAQGLFDFLMKRLEGFTVAGQASQDTLKGMWSNVIDVAKQLGGNAFEGVFTGLKTELKGLLDGIVTFDSVARHANWNQKWVDGAKELREQLTTTFNTIVTVSKYLIDHADIIWGIVKAYTAYVVVTTTVAGINKVMSMLAGANATIMQQKTAATLAAVDAEALYAQILETRIISEGHALTLNAESALTKKLNAAATDAATAANLRSAEAEAAKITSLLAENTAMQHNNSEQMTSILSRGQALVADEARTAVLAESTAAYYAEARAMNAGSVSLAEYQTMNDIASAEYVAAKEARIAAETALQSKMAFAHELAIEEQALLAKSTAAQIALTNARVASMLPAATQAALAYNTALAAQGITNGAVTGTELALKQARFANLSENVQQSIVSKAHSAALGIEAAAVANTTVQYDLFTIGANAATTGLTRATIAAQASAAAMYVTAAASTALNAAFTLIGGWLGVIVIAIYVAVKAWNDLAAAKEKAMKKSMEKAESANTVTEQLKKEIEEYKAAQKLKDEIKTKGEEKVDKRTKLEAALGSDLQLYKNLEQSVQNYNNRISVLTKLGEKEELDRITHVRDAEQKSMTDMANMKLARYEQTKNIAYVANPPRKEDEDPAKYNEAVQAFNSLRDEWNRWDLQAIRSGKVQGELESRIATLGQAFDNLNEKAALAATIDKAGTEAIMKHIAAAKDLIIANTVLEENQKGLKIAEEANAHASMQSYKSDLSERKAQLQASLEDRQITHKQYFDSISTMNQEETQKEMSAQQKLVNAKKEAFNKLVEDGPAVGADVGKAAAELTKAQADLDAVRSNGAKKEFENSRNRTRYYIDEKKQILELQKALTDMEAVVSAAKAAQVGVDPKTGTMTNAIENEMAIIADAHATKMQQIQDEQNMLQKKYDDEANNIEKQKILLGQMNAKNNEGIAAGVVATQKAEKLKLDARKASEQQTLDFAKKVYPELTMLDKLVAINHATFEKDKEDKTKLSTRGQLQMYQAYGEAASAVFSGIADAQDQSSKDGFETAKALNMAAAVMSTAAGIMAQFAAPDGGLPSAWARAAIVGVMGAIQVAKIASTSFTGGGSASSSVPSGSFGASGSAASNSSGLGHLATPMASVQDSQTIESLERLTKSTDNAAVAIGRMSKSIDSLSALFKDNGAGMGIATNAPGIGASVVSEKSVGQSFLNGALTNNPLFKLNPVDLFNSIKSTVFGGDWQKTGAGITLGMNSGKVEAQDYTISSKDPGLFQSNKHKIDFANDPEAANYMQGLIKPYISDIERMALTLGTTVNVKAYQSDATVIATAGRKPEDIAKDLDAWMLKTLQGMSMTVQGLKENIGTFDDAYAALKRYNDALVSTNDALGLIGAKQLQGSFANAKAADNMQTSLFGSTEKFNSAIDSYFTTMFTTEQQTAMKAAQATKQVNSAFNEMHMAVPATRADFIALVNSLDITTESGAQTFAALMNISTAFGTMTDAATEAAKNLVNTFTDSALNAANALKEIITGSLSTKSPQTIYQEQQAAFAAALANKDAEHLPEIAKALLEASRTQNASGAGYVTDYNNVTKALADQAGITGNITMSSVDRQIQLLTDTKAAIDKGNTDQLQALLAQYDATTNIATILQQYLNPVVTSTVPVKTTVFPAFASGGITSGMSIAGEAGPEAIIPLPDGRNVPVQMTGSADNAETVAELKEQNRLLRELLVEAKANVKVQQAGFGKIIEQNDKSNESLETVERKLNLTASGMR